MMPVRTEERSYAAKSGSAHSAMNIVGTPYSDVHFSSAVALRVAAGSKPGAGMTIAAPWEVHARLPITMPKQW